ncbi:MAG TPA: hypothetical protein VID70_06590, partial [Solirubrobacteraceae bacterium]
MPNPDIHWQSHEASASQLAVVAATLLSKLWQDSGYRDALRSDPHGFGSAPAKGRHKHFSCSSVRSFEALLDLMTAEPRWVYPAVRNALAENLPSLLRSDARRLDPVHPADPEMADWLTYHRRALLVCALAKACFWEPQRDEVEPVKRETLKAFRKNASRRLRAELDALIQVNWRGQSPPHPYFTYTVARAVDLGSRMLDESILA